MDSLQEIENIRDMIIRLSRKLRGSLKKRLAKSGFGIMPLPYNLLALLAIRNLTLQEIALEMEINPPTLVAATDILENKGFLKRTVDMKDRRRTPLQITKAGHAVLKKVPKVSKSDSFAVSLSRLDKTQRAQLLNSLTRLLI